ncbi:DUF4383 domain-containing protein [Geodermatophilus sp. URMC 64]
MSLLSLGHGGASPLHRVSFLPRLPRLPRRTAEHVPAPVAVDDQPAVDGRVFAVQRLGAVGVGTFLLVFGTLGLTSGVPFLSTHGQRLLGLSSNGLLSVLSVVVGAVLVGAALRGPRVASTVMMVLGSLFLLSSLVNLALLQTGFNVLAFRISNVLFSIGVGVLLLVLGAYGRVSGNLPETSPYAHPHPHVVEPPELPSTPEEVAAEAAMREAEIAVVEHRATEDQQRRVAAMARVHSRPDRRHVWMEFDRPTAGPGSHSPAAVTRASRAA